MIEPHDYQCEDEERTLSVYSVLVLFRCAEERPTCQVTFRSSEEGFASVALLMARSMYFKRG